MDDVARAEEALVEAMAQESWDSESDGVSYVNLPPGYQEMLRRRMRPALAAAREVTVETTCARCDGRSEITDIVGGNRMEDWLVPCPDCSNGTVSRSALAVLIEGNRDE